VLSRNSLPCNQVWRLNRGGSRLPFEAERFREEWRSARQVSAKSLRGGVVGHRSLISSKAGAAPANATKLGNAKSGD
jgi:hypothetical protein